MKLTTLIIIACSISAIAANTYQENAMNIEGRASMKVVPDMATIYVGASAVHQSVDSAMEKCAQAFTKLNALFKKYKISENDVKSENMSISEDFSYENGIRKINGYKVFKNYKITWRDLKTLQNFLFDAAKQGANEIDRLEFSHSKSDSLEKAIIDLAIDDAVGTAQQIAKKMKIKIGKPLVISNVEPEKFAYENIVRFGWTKAPQYFSLRSGATADASPKNSALFEINPGQIEIKNKVYITFGIVK
ncbi:MAG: SIMPL domain-containing protein [Fibrobacter sp.]|nr:SIMPL domain-containing protein [Fibrobacter sp.]